MQVHREINKLPPFRKAAITIGTFDGVHKGHQQIINALVEKAKGSGGESVLITFHPHPRKIVQPDASLELINSLEERIALLEEKGIDHLVVVPFTPSFASQEPENYIGDFLAKLFSPKHIIIGYDHHFGKDRKGGYRLLEENASKFGYHLIEIPGHVLNEIAVSSTKIRAAIRNSQMDEARDLLGYSWFFEGEVVHGDQLGRKLGYPTANLTYIDGDKIHLGEGVYAAMAELDGEKISGMLSVGTRPTIGDHEEKVEINLFNFNRDIYGSHIKVTVKNYLRAQVKYGSLDALKNQMETDKINAENALTNR